MKLISILLYYIFFNYTYQIRILSTYLASLNKFNTINTNKVQVIETIRILKKLMDYDYITSKPMEYFFNLSNNIENTLNSSLNNISNINISQYKKINISNEIKSFIEKANQLRNPKDIVDSIINFISNIPEVSSVFYDAADKFIYINSIKKGNLQFIIDNNNNTDNNNFSFKQKSSLNSKGDKTKYANIIPPLPFISTDTACNQITCAAKQLQWMKCTVKDVSLRTMYETANIPIHIISLVTWGLCACSATITNQMINTRCSNTHSYPGVPCNVAHLALKQMVKISADIWDSYSSANLLCKNPITPL